MKAVRKVFGVISASTADIANREMIISIIEEANRNNIDIAVISNIYNPSQSTDRLNAENFIYDLLNTGIYDGFIVLLESFVNYEIREMLFRKLAELKDIPTVAVGTRLDEKVPEHIFFINTDDEADFEAITDHLLDVHAYKQIDILSGPENMPTSHSRVNGCINSMKKNGLSAESINVHFGNFWINSGSELARKYISGELPYPQALICANDYMAYGVLDEFMEQGIDIRKKMTLIGYEYSGDRLGHTPLLTTYYRDCKAMGKAAVHWLLYHESEDYTFKSPQGHFIFGRTCPCDENPNDTQNEVQRFQRKQTYDFLNLFCQQENRLTECHNIDEFVEVCREFEFMIRNRSGVYLCLYENWYEEKIEKSHLVAYDLIEKCQPLFFGINDLKAVFADYVAAYYFFPIFFAKKALGFVVIRYDSPDSYDLILRNWLKTISNGLEFLRMKNDIRYLTECQSLSEKRDMLTGLYNEMTIRNVFGAAEKKNLYFIELKVGIGSKVSTEVLIDTAEALCQFTHSPNVCARINQNTFVCFVASANESDFLEDELLSILSQHDTYMKECGTDSAVCKAVRCENYTYNELKKLCEEAVTKKADKSLSRKADKNYSELIQLRNYIYQHPTETFDTDNLHRRFWGSASHLRKIYKACFGISFHQDCIKARIRRAKYLLALTSHKTGMVAELCGYSDEKYFMRQFLVETGNTVNEYRNMTR